MALILLIVKGIIMGIANIIPGVSGGTMAVSFGIFDDMISSVSNFFKDWKKSLKFLLPLIIGLATGIILFSYAIEFLLSRFTLPTALAFVGLILGGFPILISSFKESLSKEKKKINAIHFIIFIALIALVVGFSLLQEPQNTLKPLEFSLANIIILFLVGMIASATMVIPGISGSLVLMILGFYYSIINSITSFVSALRAFDIKSILNFAGILVPFGLGIILGIFLISKLIDFLFQKFPSYTYSGILGLIVASPFALLYNTESFSKISTMPLIIGLVLAILTFMLTYYLGKIDPEKR